jgi:small-conductance mechanosensitive channel
MTLNDFLQFTLIHFKTYELKVYQIMALLIIYFSTKIILYMIRRIVHRRLHEKISERGRAQGIFMLISYFIWLLSIFIMIELLAIRLTYVLASSAALFVGLGLGLQDVFKDIIAGLFILGENNVRIGDVMEVDGVIGKVTGIKVRTSTIRTRDGILMIVPNSKFINDNVINWSKESEATRFKVSVGVAYGSDHLLVKKILMDCAQSHPEVILNEEGHEPFVRLVEFGSSSMDFELFFWTHNVFPVENTRSDIRFEIKASFNKNNIVIPFPQSDIHIKTDMDGKLLE